MRCVICDVMLNDEEIIVNEDTCTICASSISECLQDFEDDTTDDK